MIIGGAGDDVLNGVYGNDRLEGGDGIDTAVFSGGSGYYTIRHYVGYITVSNGDKLSTLFGIERIQFDDRTYLTAGGAGKTGTSANDWLTGSPMGYELLGLDGDDTLSGGLGDDIINAGRGNDRIDGGGGNDVLIVSGAAEEYRLLIDGDNFILKGVDGRDSLAGVERLHFSDGRVLELNRMYDVARDGVIPDALLDGAPQVLPGVGRGAEGGKGVDGPEVLPGPSHDKVDDAFVLPATPDDQPLEPPGLDAWKSAEEPLVLPGREAGGPLLAGLEARLAQTGDWMLALDADGGILVGPVSRPGEWM